MISLRFIFPLISIFLISFSMQTFAISKKTVVEQQNGDFSELLKMTKEAKKDSLKHDFKPALPPIPPVADPSDDSASQEIQSSEINNETQNDHLRIEENDKFITNRVLAPLEKKYIKSVVDKHINDVERKYNDENEKRFFSEDFEDIYNTYMPLLRNYGTYTQELHDIVVLLNKFVSDPYYYNNHDERVSRTGRIIEAFKAGKLKLKKGSSTEMPFKYHKVYKESENHPSIYYLDDRIEEVNVIMDNYLAGLNTLGKNADARNLALKTSAELDKIAKLLDGEVSASQDTNITQIAEQDKSQPGDSSNKVDLGNDITGQPVIATPGKNSNNDDELTDDDNKETPDATKPESSPAQVKTDSSATVNEESKGGSLNKKQIERRVDEINQELKDLEKDKKSLYNELNKKDKLIEKLEKEGESQSVIDGYISARKEITDKMESVRNKIISLYDEYFKLTGEKHKDDKRITKEKQD